MKKERSIIKPLTITFSVIVLIVLLMIGFSVLTYNINVSRLNNGEAPLFVYHANGVTDGGTVIYHGFGYHIIKWHSFIENTTLEGFDPRKSANKDTVYVCGWDIGRGSDRNTIQNGPSPEHTIDFHLEYHKTRCEINHTGQAFLFYLKQYSRKRR